MTDAAKYVLRNLPGVAEFAALLAKVAAHPNPNWAPEYDQIKPMADQLSQRLFGIDEGGTLYERRDPSEDWEAGYDAWESQFEFLEDPRWFSEEGAPWCTAEMLELGWDVDDADGNLHPTFEHFERQIVCASKGLRGRLPDTPISDEEAKARATDWGSSLETAAANFHSKSRKGRDR